MQHTWLDPVLRAHYAKTPMPPEAGKLLDLPPDVFLDTEEEINVIAACLWMMSVRYDGLTRDERPKTPELLRRWIVRYRAEAVGKIASKIEPPFTAWSIDQIEKDVGAMMEELLVKTLPPPEEKKPEEGAKGKDGDKGKDNDKDKKK